MHRTLLLAAVFLVGCNTLEPGEAMAQPVNAKTNVIFVVDVSGSMSGNKLDQTKNALQRSVDLLPDNANMGLMIFNERHQWLIPIGELNRRAAKAKIREINVGGNTGIGRALDEATLRLAGHQERINVPNATFQIILLSDGGNTAGHNPDGVVPKVRANGQRLDVIGIEYSNPGLSNALKSNGFADGYHEVGNVDKLFEKIEQVLNIEEVTVSDDGVSDYDRIADFPPKAATAILKALVQSANEGAKTYVPGQEAAGGGHTAQHRPAPQGNQPTGQQNRGCSGAGAGGDAGWSWLWLLLLAGVPLLLRSKRGQRAAVDIQRRPPWIDR